MHFVFKKGSYLYTVLDYVGCIPGEKVSSEFS